MLATIRTSFVLQLFSFLASHKNLQTSIPTTFVDYRTLYSRSLIMACVNCRIRCLVLMIYIITDKDTSVKGNDSSKEKILLSSVINCSVVPLKKKKKASSNYTKLSLCENNDIWSRFIFYHVIRMNLQ